MKKFQAIIHFSMDEQFLSIMPMHYAYINQLVDKIVIDHYAVSMESQTVWITINAETKEEVAEYLHNSPFHKYLDFSVEELFSFDGHLYRFPKFDMN